MEKDRSNYAVLVNPRPLWNRGDQAGAHSEWRLRSLACLTCDQRVLSSAGLRCSEPFLDGLRSVVRRLRQIVLYLHEEIMSR